MASFLIVSLIPSIINTDPLSYLLVFLISFISSLKVITFEKPDPNILLWIAASVAGAATAANPNGIKTPLTNGLIIFPIKSNPLFSNDHKSLSRIPADSIILWVYYLKYLHKFYEASKRAY